MTRRDLLPAEGHRVDPRFDTDDTLDDEDSIMFESLDRWGDRRFAKANAPIHRDAWRL